VLDTLSTVRRTAAQHWERQDAVVTLRAVPNAHFVGQRVVIYADVHGVVRALRSGRLLVEGDGGTISVAQKRSCSRMSKTAAAEVYATDQRGRR